MTSLNTVPTLVQPFLFAESAIPIPEPKASVPAVKSVSVAKPRLIKQDLTIPLFDWLGNVNVAILYDHEDGDEEEPGLAVQTLSYMDGFASVQEVVHEEWTLDGIMRLHGVLLEESLKALAGRGNAKQKQEILDWIFEKEDDGSVQDALGRIYPVDVPFTFALCCKLEGLDHVELRDQISIQMDSFQ